MIAFSTDLPTSQHTVEELLERRDRLVREIVQVELQLQFAGMRKKEEGAEKGGGKEVSTSKRSSGKKSGS